MSATAAPLDVSSLSLDDLLAREWLTTNGLGGFAASTVAGANTRKYHGLLVATMSPPVRRMVLLSRVEETVFTDGWPHALATNEYPETVNPEGYKLMRGFAADPFPRWAFQGDGWALEKQLQMLDGENTVVLSYTLLGAAKGVEMEVRPLFALRGIHELMYQWNGNLVPRASGARPTLAAGQRPADAPDHKGVDLTHLHIPATHRTPEVFFAHDGRWRAEAYWYLNTIYRRESERGYSGLEDVWAPGVTRYRLIPGQTVHFVCSTDPIDLERAVARAREQEMRPRSAPVACALPRGADEDVAGLRRAADQFVARTREGRPALASGYPWAAPHGRDTMIALPGVLLTTGRYEQAKELLEDFASLAKNGLMPGEFPTDGTAPRYTAADTSLWWVNALHAYLKNTGDDATGRALFDVVDQTLTAMFRGTGLGVRADHEGLLTAGSSTTAVTWMNAQVNESPITPRHGRQVEVNALWYNALRIGADLARRYHFPVRAEELFTLANRARHAFNAAFWNPQTSCLFDVVGDGGNDPAVRPNQLLAISLPYPVLNPDRQQQVFDRVRDELLTRYGLRTLSPRDPNYHGRYGGPVLSRDGAYHNGPAFPWLLGPFLTAFVRLHGRSASARREAAGMLRPCLEYMSGAGLGQLPELFDGEPPYHAGGLPASARSVGEVLRAYVGEVVDPVNETEVKVSLAPTANGVVKS
ncbi:MAG: amylo-alpha-1,6-glucosidase [Phycisphaerae bacterium]